MADKNFEVKTSLIANNSIGIGTKTPITSLDVGSMTDAILIPKGTTEQRPAGANGMFRFNTTVGEFEGYSESLGGWSQITLVGSSVNAEFLDFQPASYYLDANNSTGTIKGANFADSSHGARTGGNLHASANSSANGFMSSADKVAFDLIPAGPDIYSNRGTLDAVVNLNNFTSPGVWSCDTAANASTTRNYPVTGNGGALIVQTNPAKTHIYQLYYERAITNLALWKRFSTDSGATWTTWNRLWDNVTLTDQIILDLIKTIDGHGSGLDADLLDGQQGSYYQNATNINAGTLSPDRISGSYVNFINLTGSGNLDFARVIGNTGGAAAPTYSFTGDLDTGMYRTAADTIAFSTAGVARMTLNGSGALSVTGSVSSSSLSVSGAAATGALTVTGNIAATGSITGTFDGRYAAADVTNGAMSGSAYPRRSGGVTMNFVWSGQSGTPTYVWGGSDGTNFYVYQPTNFNVNSVGGMTWPEISSYIEARGAAHQNAAVNRSVTSSRMAGYITASMTSTGQPRWSNSGYVVVDMVKIDSDSYNFGARQPQLYIANAGWFAAFPF